MKKKIIGLSILLLVLLLGLSITSYADTNNAWTINQLKNVFYNYNIYCNRTETQANQWLESNATNLNTILNTINNYNNVYIIFSRGRSFQPMYIGYMNDNSNYWYDSGGCLYSTGNTAKHYYILFTDGRLQNRESYGMANTYEFNTEIYYFSKNVYTNSSHTNIKYGSGPKPTNLLTSPYSDNHFEFTYSIPTGSLEDSVSPLGIYPALLNINSGDTIVGYVEKAQNIDNIYMFEMYWDKYSNSFETYSATTLASNLDLTTDRYTLVFKPKKANTLISIVFDPKEDSGFFDIGSEIYVTDRNTANSNGTIDLDATFSGDYYDYYMNNINNQINNEQAQDRTDDIINSITDDSHVNELLNNFSSGDLASTLGYSPLNNPCVSFIENILTGFCDVLLSSGDVTLDLDIHGHVTTLHSSDFSTPPGVFKTFLSAILTTGYIFIMYKYFYHLVIKLETADIKKVNTEFSDNDSNLF